MAIHPNCHLIGVCGGKGGVGKSVLAANLAGAFVLEMRARVLLVDLDSQSCGDQNVITGLRPAKTVAELASFTGQINKQTLSSIAARHASGLEFLGAVRSPSEKLSVDPEALMKQLESLSALYNFIIVDLGSIVTPLQMKIIESSSVNLVVTTPEILAVNQTAKLIGDLTAATLPGDLLQVVVNKYSKAGLTPQAIGQTLRKQVIAMVPQDDVTTAISLQRNMPFVIGNAKTPIAAAYHDIVRRLTSGGILQKLKSIARPTGLKASGSLQTDIEIKGAQSGSNPLKARKEKVQDTRTLFKQRVHQELIATTDFKKGMTETKGDPEKEKALRQRTQQSISQITDRIGGGIDRGERAQIIKEVLDEALGLGPLEDLLANDDVTEIMVNGPYQIFIEKKGRISLSPVTFTGHQQLLKVIERIMIPLGRRIDDNSPYQDARLPDGSRVNAVIEPIAIDGASLTIRKFAKTPITAENYIKWGTLTEPMIDFLRICVEQGLNIVISGGTGSGKTTLLNVLSSFIPSTERIVTVEDAAELQLKQEHIVRLETKPPSLEGTGEVTIRDLIRNSLRMRPDRIVVGECRGGEALDMLQAMNTGHDGSMTTLHANSPREAMTRLETLCMMAGMDLPVKAIREQVAGAVQLVVQISRMSDGTRKVTSIAEVDGIQGDRLTMDDIFVYKEEGFDKNRKIIGQYQATGTIPSFLDTFDRKGVKIPRNLFSNNPMPSNQKMAVGAEPSISRTITRTKKKDPRRGRK